MKVGVIGTGNMGKGIAARMVAGGHHVYVVGSTDEKSKALAGEVAGKGPGTVEAAASSRAAAIGCDVVILATWYQVSNTLAVELSDVLADKTVVDIGNPFNDTFDGLVTDYDTSSAEEIQRRMPNSKVVKGFNTTFAPTLASSEFDGTHLDVLLASDHEDARAQVAGLVESTGMRPIDFGELRASRVLEHMALLMVGVQGRYDLGFQAGLKVLPAQPMPFPARQSVRA